MFQFLKQSKVFGCLSGASFVYLTAKCSRYQVISTEGDSMLPTVNVGGRLLVYYNEDYIQQKLKRGDVVLCRSIVKPQDQLIKRVTAMEGDCMPESLKPINRFLRHADRDRVPLGYVWVSGDNEEVSLDSRHYGPIPLALVEGIVLYQVYPKFKTIESAL